ncbi:rhomboid family intramembrane serine protease [Kitasatospora sp. NPDC096147]|uniref:rhomboid family intramembrane serine protease n=1 Tax=Kitasatospora sp. NPDC096147 TaxID=3364093 RepID=UPI003821E5BF
MAAEQTPAPDYGRMVTEARRAFYVMFGLLCLVWGLHLVNWLTDYRLSIEGGILPRDPESLPDLLSSAFLHFNWEHLEGNSGPLFIFGFLAAYRGVKRFLGLTALLTLTSGAAVWLFSPEQSLTVGASGLVFGYFGYVVLRGLIDRNLIDSLIGVVMGASFAYILVTAVPGTPGISWQGHLGGLVGGLAGAWIFRERRRKAPAAPGTTGTPGTDAPALPAQAAPTQSSAALTERQQLLKELDDLGL